MSEIKRGDLVMVVSGKPCCGYARRVGEIFIVDRLLQETELPCGECGNVASRLKVLAKNHARGYQVDRLKKLDPPPSGELKGVPLRIKEPV